MECNFFRSQSAYFTENSILPWIISRYIITNSPTYYSPSVLTDAIREHALFINLTHQRARITLQGKSKLSCAQQSTYLILKVGLLTVWPVLLSTVCSQHPVSTHPSPSGALPPGKRVNGDGVLIKRSTPLRRQRASQQSEATYHPISITPAAGRPARRGATLRHVDSVSIGIGRPMLCACWRDIEESMLWQTHRLSRVACWRTNYM